MITAKEYADRIGHGMTWYQQDIPDYLEKAIKQIQLDAWKQGMLDAIDVCYDSVTNVPFQTQIEEIINNQKEPPYKI